MSDEIEVIVTIEPDFLDVESAGQALGNVGKDELAQVLHVGLINGHEIGERTAFGWRKCGGSASRAGAPNCEMSSHAIGG
jgi:hypothetical protein